VLGLTSNKGSEDFQQLVVRTESEEFLSEITLGHHHKQQYLYEKVMQQIAGWGTPENLMFVVGATKAAQLQQIRKAYTEHFFLVPGVGSQGGSLAEVSRAALHADGGLLVNVSRAIIYAGTDECFAEDAMTIARQYHDEMNILFDEVLPSL
jgi:orotidine-5'-phosphate decarboxylase